MYFICHTAEFGDISVRGGDIPYLDQIANRLGIQVDKKKLNKPKIKALVLLINYLKTRNCES